MPPNPQTLIPPSDNELKSLNAAYIAHQRKFDKIGKTPAWNHEKKIEGEVKCI
jgi:hypothetical protein